MNNLERIVCAMGFPRINPEALEALRLQGKGAFTRLAAQHHLSVTVGIEARKEFESLMAQGAIMFAPAAPKAVPFGTAPNDVILTLNMVTALRRMIDQMDESTSNSEGAYPGLEPGCNDCTQGCTPKSADTGLCGYHFGKNVIAAWERRIAQGAAVGPQDVKEGAGS
jgi:hypothetical protein